MQPEVFNFVFFEAIDIPYRTKHFAIEGWRLGLGADVCRRDARNERFFFTYPVEKGYPRFCGGQASAALDLLDVGSVRGGKPKNNIQMRTRWIGLLKVIFQQQPLHLERRISSLEEFAP